MKVIVKHFASLKQAAGRGYMAVELAPGAKVSELLVKIGIEQDEVGVLIVSGKQATFGQELKENDRVTFIPPIGGG